MKQLLSLFFLFAGAFAFAETIDVYQKDKQFVVKGNTIKNKGTPDITIKQGDVVRFYNDDEFFHNVFSLSDAKLFDLGSYPKGEYREIEFDQKGVVEIECAIHPNMFMSIEVK